MRYSPHDLLPCKHPKEQEFKEQKSFFYDNVVQHLVPDVVRIIDNGIPIDLEKVQDLEKVVDNVLKNVTETLSSNKLIKRILEEKYKTTYAKKKEQVTTKLKTLEDFNNTIFSYSNIVHRTSVINIYLRFNDLEDLVKDKWTLKDVKQLYATHPSIFLESFISQQTTLTNIYITEGMKELAAKKVEIHNKRYNDSLSNIPDIKFNPNSPVDKQLLYTMLGLPTEKVSKKTNLPTINREQLKLTLDEINILLENHNE